MKRNIERAVELEERYPEAAEMLRAYRELRPPEKRRPCLRTHAKAVVAVLRPEGDGGKRYLVCSQCLSEREFRRLVCPSCGEEDPKKLPVYKAEQFPHVRVEACDNCRVYIKCIDMTVDGLAVPEVDEIASITMDLWASEKGYTKLQTNMFGL
jgi:FdhE protein